MISLLAPLSSRQLLSRRDFRRTIMVCVLAACCMAHDALCDSKDPNGFFPKDYVSQGPRGTNRSPTSYSTPSTIGATPTAEVEGFREFGDEITPPPLASPTPAVQSTGKKIISISGFVAGETIPDGINRIAEAGSLLFKFRIPVRHLSIVCNPLDFSQSMKDAFNLITTRPELMRGFTWISPSFRIIPKVPDRYQVTNSPVWLIETEEGETIVEGEGPSLEEMISPNGEFLLPAGAPEAVKQLPPPPRARTTPQQQKPGVAEKKPAQPAKRP